MKRLLAVLLTALAVACSDATGPGTLPRVAGVWRFDGALTDGTVTCRVQAVQLYLSQTDSTFFSGQTKEGVYMCSNGVVFPFPTLYVAGTVSRDRTVQFDLVPYFSLTGRLTYDGQTMSGTLQFASGALGRWKAERVTP